MAKYELTAFWDARTRSVELYAEDLLQLVKSLGDTDARLARWYVAGEAGRTLITRAEQIRDALVHQATTWEHGDETYRAFELRLENDAPEGGAVSIDVLVGVDRPSGPIWFPNRVGMRFWGPGARDAFDDIRLVVRWLESSIAIFEPDWATVCPEGRLDAASEDLFDGKPVVCWLLYLAPSYGAIEKLPSPALVRPMRGGHVVATVSGWFDPSDPAHEAAADAVRDALDAQGKRPRRVILTPD